MFLHLQSLNARSRALLMQKLDRSGSATTYAPAKFVYYFCCLTVLKFASFSSVLLVLQSRLQSTVLLFLYQRHHFLELPLLFLPLFLLLCKVLFLLILDNSALLFKFPLLAFPSLIQLVSLVNVYCWRICLIQKMRYVDFTFWKFIFCLFILGRIITFDLWQTYEEFDMDIKEDVEGECSKFGKLKHIFVEKCVWFSNWYCNF